MTDTREATDVAIFERLDLSYSKLAEIQGESRQNARQMVQSGRSSYFTLERLQRLYHHFTETAPDPARAGYVRGLIEARLPLTVGEARGLRDVTAGAWTTLLLSLAQAGRAPALLRQVRGTAQSPTRKIVVVAPRIAAAELEHLCTVGFVVPATLTVIEWGPAGLYPGQVLLEEVGGRWCAYGLADQGLAPLAQDDLTGVVSAWQALIESGAGVRLRDHPARLDYRGEPVGQTEGAGAQRLEYRFTGSGGDYRLLLENVPGWGWLLRLDGEGGGRRLLIEDGEGREWLRVDGARLPYQGLWPHAGVNPAQAVRHGLFLRTE